MARARVVRWVVIGVCVAGIAGMIVGSVADNNDVALTFGLITAAAVVCLMVATAVSPPGSTASSGDAPAFDEGQAARVEHLVGRLVADGAREDAVRQLVGEAVRLGRGTQSSQEIPHIRLPDADD
jgi:predicted MFS family arabinose efflux permease